MQRDAREPREGLRRGYVIHQKVVLEVDFSGTLFGYTEIIITPTTKDLRTIHLHSKQCVIHGVTIGGYQTDYVQLDPFVNLTLSTPKDCHLHPELKRRVYSSYAEADEGELSIAIPRTVQLVMNTDSVSRSGTPAERASSVAPSLAEFTPITVRIEYSLSDPVDGIQFVVPTDAYPYRIPHAYTTPSSPDAARCWVPCLDNMNDKCTWELQFVVPRQLEEEDEQDETGSYPTVVVCSGDFGEQVSHPSQSGKTIFLFSQSVATSVQQISWAAGPFHVYPVPTEHLDDSTASQPLMHAFCLPGHEAQLISSVTFLRSAMNFFASDLGSYPFNSHKLVFVDELPTQRFDTSTMSLVTVDLLHGEDAIDQVYETRLSLTHALACQWAGINMQPRTPSDTWLINGLGLYITGLFLKKLFGVNEHRFRIKKDMDRVLEHDTGMLPPICQPQNLDPPEGAVLHFINLKAPLVLHILDRRLTKSGTSLGLSRVLPKLFLQAMSGELVNNQLSTHAFLRLCRKVSGMDPRSFAEQWIYGSGFPAFHFSASFNRKKMAVEIRMTQECPAHKMHEQDELGQALFKPVPFFEGQMTIRIHEADGTPYEHVLDIRAPFKRFEVPFNTKYKRVRRNTKRYMARQAAAQAAVDGEEVAPGGPVPGELVDVGFAVEIWDNDRERDNWKISEWTEEDEQKMAGATYEWIRLDADLEWITAITFDQPDFMWVSQLQRDRDVVAQLEAVHALKKQPTAIISSVLVKTVLISKYFYRIRCEAALALASCAVPKLDYLGLFHLFKLFLRYCYEPEDPRQDLFTHTYVPRSNDFSDLPEYFVRKALVNGLSRVRFDNGKTPSIIRQFLIDQLRFNDNTSNPYSDAFYICTVITALAGATVPTKPPERNEIVTTEIKVEHTPEDVKLLQLALAEIDRYRSMDRLIPSSHNVVTIASIEFYVVLSMADLIPNDPRTFCPLTREGHYTNVRMAAFDALFLTKWYTPKMMRYFFAVMAHDPSRIIRRHIARNACHSLALLFSMGELKASTKENEMLLIEEDGNMPVDKVKEAKKSEVDLMIRAFRKDRELGKSEVVREFLMPIALAPDVDHDVRWHLLKLGDLLLRGADEAPPKVIVRLPPPTPVQEFAQTPFIRQPIKREKVKADGSMRSPLTPLGTGGLKLTIGPSSSIPTPLPKGPKTPSVPRTPSIVIGPPKPVGRPVEKKLDKPIKRAREPEAKPVMERAQRVACKNVLTAVSQSKHSQIFLQPVDPVRDKAPNYFTVIRRPMDLGTIRAKLEGQHYVTIDDMEADFNLMVENCKQYNADGTYAFLEAIALDKVFKKQMNLTRKTLQKFVEQGRENARAREEMAPPAPPPSVPRTPIPSTSASASASRSGIIKIGKVTLKPKGPARDSPAPAPATKQNQKRPKPAIDSVSAEEPPPPYEDDGSHDILQEVIAMELESPRSEKRPSEKRPSGSSIKINVGKRKRPATHTEEDDDTFFDMVSAKKERSASAAPSPIPTEAPRPKPKLIISAPKKAATPAAPSPVVRASPAPLSMPSTPTPAPSRKGKEKEIVPAAVSTPPPPRVPTPAPRPPAPVRTPSQTPAKVRSPQTTTPIDTKKCKDIIKNLLKLPEAIIFSRPVDPVMDGCPTYLDEIKKPMDLGTMQTKLVQGKYSSMESFAADYRLIIHNCRIFNPPMTYPTDCADVLDKTFEREWAKVSEKKLSYGEKRSLQSVMNKVVADPISWVFHEPVDPVILGIPTYHDIIPKKDARDLRTIRTKLDNDKYTSVEAFEADIDLMINNAILFNTVESEVGQIATAVRAKVREAMASVNLGSKKRKDTGGTPLPGAKKIKLL